MAGELTLTKRKLEDSTMANWQWRWRVQYSRCFSYPSSYISSHNLNNDNPLSLSLLEKKRFIPTWLSTVGSSTVSLQPSDHSSEFSVFSVSLLDTVLEEHYVSKLHFAWPQVSCLSGFPTRGSLVLIASYYDNAGEKQKFALRFSTPSNIENFITSLEDVISNKLPKEPSPIDVLSPVSSQSEFVPPYRPDTSSIKDPIYASSELMNFHDENQQEAQSQTQDIVPYSDNNGAAFPPSFTSLLSSCYADPDQNALALTLAPEVQEPDLKAQIAKYMQDASFLDIVSKVNEVISELGGDFAI
ncbi:protein POOR HOMOLOGOUS SYNAPSIS 1-like [Silene latifolia]|uniref:protein POOR HOMOLOGOUS SYNAPSIS 1-like n=1 Tax=Silene latifolia TaxID=37657 RepID=UPI003D77A250